MAYVSVMGGQEAISRAAELTKAYRLRQPEYTLDVKAIEHRMRLLTDRIMSEGGLYEPGYAALALKQAEGDPFEAAFLLRAYRSTLPRVASSFTTDTTEMRIIRRISSAFRDIPGGQILGPTYDYTHRLLDFSLMSEGSEEHAAFLRAFLLEHGIDYEDESGVTFEKISDHLRRQGLLAEVMIEDEKEPFDITRQKLTFPAPRSARLQTLARGETGAMTALAYSSLRGYGAVHPTIGELRVGYVPVYVPYPIEGGGSNPEDTVYLGEVMATDVETINSFTRDKKTRRVQFVLGYGFCYGQNELKAISMAVLERSLESDGKFPTQDEEFVLLHIDSVDAAGFVGHTKLPHYVTFQSSLDSICQVQEHGESPEPLVETNDEEEVDE